MWHLSRQKNHWGRQEAQGNSVVQMSSKVLTIMLERSKADIWSPIKARSTSTQQPCQSNSHDWTLKQWLSLVLMFKISCEWIQKRWQGSIWISLTNNSAEEWQLPCVHQERMSLQSTKLQQGMFLPQVIAALRSHITTKLSLTFTLRHTRLKLKLPLRSVCSTTREKLLKFKRTGQIWTTSKVNTLRCDRQPLISTWAMPTV